MKSLRICLFLLLTVFSTLHAAADTRIIVRDTLGINGLNATCLLLGCHVVGGLGDDQGQVFLVTVPPNVSLGPFLNALLHSSGIVDVELDQVAKARQSYSSGVPASLYDKKPVNYYGTTVREGYVNQPAAQIIRIAETQRGFNVRGAGTVAVIDTGVDPSHPVLKNVLVPGYDFTRNRAGIPDEKSDLNQSTAAVLDGSEQPVIVNQSTAAVLDQSTAAVLDNNQQYADFGHGTMVSGVIHLVAPGARIMPLKAFKADGTGFTSDVIRAVYFAVHNNAKVLSMSFSFRDYSTEMYKALSYATSNGLISVASAGNDGKNILVYPAAYDNVMGVASTANNDQRSTFSNYGKNLVWVAAPGEGIVTTYPWGSWAAAWGTSFSAPFVSGAAALLVDVKASCNESDAAEATAHAKDLSKDLGNGRLDLYKAVKAWIQDSKDSGRDN